MPPVNDNLADAIELTPSTLEQTLLFNTGGATFESGEIGLSYGTQVGHGSIWFKIQCPADGAYTLYFWASNNGDDGMSSVVMSGFYAPNSPINLVTDVHELQFLSSYLRVSANNRVILNGIASYWYYLGLSQELYGGLATDSTLHWQVESTPGYSFYGPSNVVVVGDEGYEGGSQWNDPVGEDSNVYREFIYLDGLKQVDRRPYGYEQPVGLDSQGYPHSTLFENADWFQIGLVRSTDGVLVLPWWAVNSSGDQPVRIELWAYEDGLVNQPNREFAAAAIESLGIDGDVLRVHWLLESGGYLWLFFTTETGFYSASTFTIAKLTLDGVLVSSHLYSLGILTRTVIFTGNGNRVLFVTLTSQIKELDLDTHAVVGTYAITTGTSGIMLRNDGSLIATDSRDSILNPELTITLYGPNWRSDLTSITSWDMWNGSYIPDPAWFDTPSLSRCILDPSDDSKVLFARFYEPWVGHQRPTSGPLRSNWLSSKLYSFDVDVEDLSVVGWWEPYPRWGALNGPNWPFIWWLIPATDILV